MKILSVTDGEMEVLKHAIEVINDITTDTLLDDTVLFPQGREAIVLDAEMAKAARNNIYEATNRLIAIRTLMVKLDLHTNEAGYSV